LALVAALLVPISASADETADYDAVKAETLRLAGVTPPAGTEEEDTKVSSETAPAWWPWKTDKAAEKPPEPNIYKTPTLAGDGLDYHRKPADLVIAPAIDADAVFKTVIGCYPEKSKYDIDLRLDAAVRSQPFYDPTASGSALGRSYVGIVASMPLYSGKELDKEKALEYGRRKDTAKTVADFVAAIAARNQAVRELALFRSLESRSAVRVQSGVVEATEQVDYLEKVMAAQTDLINQEAKIMENRLMLAGMCDPVNADKIGAWLKKTSAVPATDE
jgi:hypothetical protein